MSTAPYVPGDMAIFKTYRSTRYGNHHHRMVMLVLSVHSDGHGDTWLTVIGEDEVMQVDVDDVVIASTPLTSTRFTEVRSDDDRRRIVPGTLVQREP